MTKPFPECHAQPYTGNKIKRNTTAVFKLLPLHPPRFRFLSPHPPSFVYISTSFLYAAVMAWRTRAPRCLELSLCSWVTALDFSMASSPSVRMSSMWQGLDM